MGSKFNWLLQSELPLVTSVPLWHTCGHHFVNVFRKALLCPHGLLSPPARTNVGLAHSSDDNTNGVGALWTVRFHLSLSFLFKGMPWGWRILQAPWLQMGTKSWLYYGKSHGGDQEIAEMSQKIWKLNLSCLSHYSCFLLNSEKLTNGFLQLLTKHLISTFILLSRWNFNAYPFFFKKIKPHKFIFLQFWRSEVWSVFH